MKSTKKTWLFILIILALTLTACGGKTATEAEATAVDPAAIFTSAAATVAAQLTETAIAFSPTPEPATATSTSLPTATLVQLTTPLPNLTATLLPGLPTATLSIPPTPGGPICDEMKYGSPVDVTIPDGTVMEPGEDFYKIWRIYNTGVCTWDDGYQLVVLSGTASLDSPQPAWEVTDSIAPGEVVDIGVHLTAPLAEGEVQNCFIMQNDRGVYFGGVLCVIIDVQKKK